MNLLQGNVKKLYSKYFAAAFGSALISSVYGLVDMAMVGQYAGPSGTAAVSYTHLDVYKRQKQGQDEVLDEKIAENY